MADIDFTEVINAINNKPIAVDFTQVINAINKKQVADHSGVIAEIHKAVSQININTVQPDIDFTEVINTISNKQINVNPQFDVNAIIEAIQQANAATAASISANFEASFSVDKLAAKLADMDDNNQQIKIGISGFDERSGRDFERLTSRVRDNHQASMLEMQKITNILALSAGTKADFKQKPFEASTPLEGASASLGLGGSVISNVSTTVGGSASSS